MEQSRGTIMRYSRRSFLRTVTLALFCAGLSLSGCVFAKEHVYLTWQGDTSTTMTVTYHTPDAPKEAAVRYDTESRGGQLDAYAHRVTGKSHQIPGLEDGRYINVVELTGLEAGGTYYFTVESGKFEGQEMKFHTIPNDGSPLRFITGGDIGILPAATQLKRKAAEYDPHFAIIGGDLPYANGLLKNVFMWDRYLGTFQNNFVRSDGAMIPIVSAIGNHETNKDFEEPELKAPFYFGFLPQGGSTYFSLTFGPDIYMVILDTNHIIPHAGAQTEWLAAELEKHKDYKYRFACYHVPLYPSHRSFEGSPSVAGREHWLPLFDKYHLTAAFENHDHTFKRTKLLRGNQVDPEGTLYLGDGCMGVPARSCDNKDEWYIEKASGTQHFWVVDVDQSGVVYRAVNIRGEVFDRYPEE
jgi:hypothetical protein